MKNKCRLVLVFGLALLIVSPTLAQRQRSDRSRGPRPQSSGGSSLFLLGQESVQKELKLSDEQVTKIKDVQQKQREALRGLRDVSREERRTKIQEQARTAQKSLQEILEPEQQKRLEQIRLQRAGARALGRKEVADALQLTQEQKDRIETIQKEARKERSDLRGGGSNNDDTRKKLAEIRKSTNEKMMNVLTTQQQAKLKEMTGEPFKGEIRAPQRRGGGQSRS